ncbi:SusC/RagA family TonB-linked outer membrane protein [Yeosuana aromativorans]|uniref:SusC/RagA family TonB-linked outer membrane protein n=1 Tax=Yeosuana aromativorans TaxID=288019 RepID=A0A8J3BMS6_9FLAO|nr:TonB-dependent receptor [Yeosuana aromativorans]GGK33771.1 SusC/RagA family TonB-linked outer membrane protein [Yeosuana aromativorans]
MKKLNIIIMKIGTIKNILLVVSLLFTGMIYSQTKITGTVTDDNGLPLPGVNISIKGTQKGTVSDFDGKYSIDASSNDILEYSYIGYLTQAINIGGKTTINVTMKPSIESMDEVVVIGYGSQKRSDVTGAVTSINTDALESRPITNIEQALQGQAAGLSVSSTGGQPGAATKMNIRGISSVSGSSQPLIVIDGFPIDQVSTSGGGGLEAFSSQISAFAYVNPDDIATIEVLKDASATAIYGNRGANGVIMITTKKGNKKGEAGITYSTYMGLHEMNKRLDVLDFAGYVKYQQTSNPNNRLFTSETGVPYVFSNPDAMNVNWQDVIYRTGFTQNHSLSAQGRSDKTNYAVSASYTQDKSVLIETNYKKLTNRISVDHKFNDILKVGGSLTYSNIVNNGVPTDGREGTAAGVTITALVAAPFHMDNDTQAYFRRAGVSQSNIDNVIQGNLGEPDNVAKNTDLDKNINRTISNLYADFKFLDWLSFKTTLGIDIYNLKDQQFYSTKTPSGQLNNGLAIQASVNAKNIVSENYFTFSEEFGKHNVNLVAGFSYQKHQNEFNRIEGRDFQNETLGYNSLQGAGEFTAQSSADDLVMQSYLARANYSYDNRFLLTGSFRRDGTSRFQKNKWGNFYSGALAWNVHNEAFLKDSELISNLKLRASIGQVGNASVPVQGALLDQTYSNYTFNGTSANGVSPLNLENKDLTWETTTQTNAGIDLGLFKNALNITADYYIKKTTNLLLNTPVSISTGFASGWFNIGEIENSGFELSLDYALTTKRGFGWSTKFNFTTQQNKINALGGDGEPIYIDVNYDAINTDEVILQVGGSINDLYGYTTDGIYLPSDFNPDGSPKAGVATAGAGEKPGDIKYADINNDGAIDGFDRSVIGNTLPNFFGSWSNNFSFKGIELDVVLQYSYGNDVFNATTTRVASFPGGNGNQSAAWLDRWTPQTPNNTQYARVPSLRPADYLIEDGSFIRLQTVRLGFNLPSKLTDALKIKSAKVYVAGDNLAVFTKYSGYDPEVTSNQVDYRYPFVQGFDYGAFPRAKTYLMGLNIHF